MGDVEREMVSWTITPRNNRAERGVWLVNFYRITSKENVFQKVLQQFRKENLRTYFNVNEQKFLKMLIKLV